MNPTRPARRRSTLAGGVLLSASLLVGCASTPPPPPGAEDVSTALPSKPTVKKQPKPEMKADDPRYMLYGVSSATGQEIWQQSLDLVHNWTLNPKYMQRHKVKDVKELDGLAELMTPDAAKRWKQQAHRALKGYVKPYKGWWEKKKDLDVWVNQLVAYNLMIRRDRGWDNPMLTPIKITDGLVAAGHGGIGVIFTINTKFRLMGQGKKYRVPTQSALGLAWVPTSDGWKLDQWWRVYKFNQERLKGWRPGDPPPEDPGNQTSGELEALNNPSADATVYPD
ncbi:hypothetical protein [Nocardioides jejuensis]|uniref:Lipoprotein n=1 Tax=Nocardioides jejuensis TaxID=2502782 RepID=A0A4R1CHK6_9ACTN|nr:hypothetical protein [Nocardioides jejuensis]TCJ30237.1 hypothetical protein EPD65_04965 [Nocardioides jejuensis]